MDVGESEAFVDDLPSPGRVKYLISKLERKAVETHSAAIGSASDVSPDSAAIEDESMIVKRSVSASQSVPILKLDVPNGAADKNDSIAIKAQSSDGISRFLPWVNSLTRKKGKEAKSRRNSQFYTSPPDEPNSDKSSTSDYNLSPTLPDDGDGSICSVSMELTPLDSDAESINKPVDSDLDSGNTVETCEQDRTAPTNKSYLVAKELVSSEKVFIDTLRLLNVEFRNFVEFHSHESKTIIIPDGDFKKIFNQLPELQILNEDLLLDMKQRLDNWHINPKIADVIVKKGAFLKMYATYAQNFRTQTEFLDECCKKYPKFGKIVKEFEGSEQCRKLAIQHHMLKPVQRIPQYRLLLDDYLKHLDVTSVDYEDTLTALRIVTNVAEHVNNYMKLDEKISRMVGLQSMLGDYQLIQPGRELIKDGPLEKVCRKSCKDRYFILLNDCLLYSTPYKNVLKFHQRLSLGGMKVKCKEDDINLHTFTVYSTTKSFVLSARNDEERKQWVEALCNTISDYNARKRSFMLGPPTHANEGFKLGKEAPVWIPDGKVTMCQLCTADFTQLYRRHHCRACGKVVCWRCSDNQAPLQYKSYKPQRVCDPCLNMLLHDFEENEDTIRKELGGENEVALQNAYLNLKTKFIRSSYADTHKPKKSVPVRLTEVSAKDSLADMSGWLRTWKSHKWKVDRKWYVLKERVLYVYGGSEDVVAQYTIPVLGYSIEKGSKENLDNVKSELIFQLTHHAQSPRIFAADTPEAAEKWYLGLCAAADFSTL